MRTVQTFLAALLYQPISRHSFSLRCTSLFFPQTLSINMSLNRESVDIAEKNGVKGPIEEPAPLADHLRGRQFSVDPEDQAIVVADQNKLHRNLKGRHMQMIAMQVFDPDVLASRY